MRPVLSVIGTRPNYMKIAPVMAAFAAHNPVIDHILVHTGQHFDANMETVFFNALGASKPDYNLEVGAGSHAMQTGEMMKRLDPVFDAVDPACVLVVGDVNSTLAAALVAAKRGIPLIHVESGLRSADRSMPEEINRIIVDQLADVLFTTERTAADNLTKEGIDSQRICFVGNVMIDSLVRAKASAISALQTLQVNAVTEASAKIANGYVLVTLHRPSNVDDREQFIELINGLNHIALQRPIIFPMHPRTKNNLSKFGLQKNLCGQWFILEPQGYFEMIGLMRDAFAVCTDSGGVQEETTMLGVPCLTLRENTERPITISQGTNRLVGTSAMKIMAAYEALVSDIAVGVDRSLPKPEYWDGQSSNRIATEIWRRREHLNLLAR